MAVLCWQRNSTEQEEEKQMEPHECLEIKWQGALLGVFTGSGREEGIW